MSSKALIFDLDGTLYDKKHLALRMVLRDLTHVRLMKLERSLRREFAGRPYADKMSFYDAFLDELSRRSSRSRRYVEKWYFENYMQNMVTILTRHYKVCPWVKGEIERLHAEGRKVALLSDYGFVREKLQAIGLAAGHFDIIADAPSCGGLKPCSAPFLHISHSLDLQPSEITVVGDRADTDGAGAETCGMKFVDVKEYIKY